ncbi:HoxA transcriptional regulator [Halosimplex rubrum]|uniref:HoxA transcriptional regulator n=1 Tax=Halosimplex rubrum TaxID=869889 RepID=A0A7D5T2A4_9EURY|nr:response regulator [Halosimplex rubrum]QLH75810.1 HoxA transcriptional regulator [Halosimplex rubrum]
MNPDETADSEPVKRERSRDGGLQRRVVLVADRDPAVTDELAAVLRERFTVRSAYDSADALASLDPDVSVALLDPSIPGLSAQRVVDRVRTDDADCQVAALADEPLDIGSTAFDDYLVKPVDDDHLTETVEQLSRRATYRTTLEAFYRVARERADASDERRERLDRRLAELDDSLDDIFGSLDGPEAYDAALRELDADP